MLVAFAWALLHSLWQGALVGLGAAALLRRAATASARYAIAHGALWAIAGGLVATTAIELDAGGAPLDLRPSVGAAASSTALPPGEVLALFVLVVWSAGALARTGQLALGLVGVHRLRRRAQPLASAWSEALDRLRARMGVRLRVAIAAVADIDGPMVVGVLRPLVLVPLAQATRVPSAAIEAALAHELAHVLRHDYLFNVLQSVVDAVLFFNPVVRWLSARARVEREFACDELAVALAVDRLDYACGLAELEGARTSVPPALAAHGGTLMSRITRILDPRAELSAARFSGTTPSLAGIVLSAAVALAVPACLAIGDEVDEQPRVAASLAIAEPEGPVEAATAAVPVVWLEDDLLPVADELDAAARRHGVDPALLAIVTWVESRGDVDARSPMGARGLMQLMPKTAEVIAQERGLSEHREELLEDPRYNLDLGAYHLAQLIEDYGGGDELDADTIALAAAAYNGGKPSADAWLRGKPLRDETARYSALVVALWNERELPESATLAARR
ncbi:MAG TPA: M56 family metallopeptidase [Nannocystaceae bacterium]|nr:M56 family metallopeptidase [Nannocystaceae bacterium]